MVPWQPHILDQSASAWLPEQQVDSPETTDSSVTMKTDRGHRPPHPPSRRRLRRDDRHLHCRRPFFRIGHHHRETPNCQDGLDHSPPTTSFCRTSDDGITAATAVDIPEKEESQRNTVLRYGKGDWLYMEATERRHTPRPRYAQVFRGAQKEERMWSHHQKRLIPLC